MTQRHQEHKIDHPWVTRVWVTDNITDGVYRATPDGAWDLICCHDAAGNRFAFLTGQETKPQDVPYTAGSGSLVISFAQHVHLPGVDAQQLVDGTLMLGNDGPDHFMLNGHRFPFPNIETVQDLVVELATCRCIASDEVVANTATFADSPRTVQRHFSQTTGVTQKKLNRVEQAQFAVRLLKQNVRPIDAALQAGYFDQAHMAKALKEIMGVTPSDVDDIHKL